MDGVGELFYFEYEIWVRKINEVYNQDWNKVGFVRWEGRGRRGVGVGRRRGKEEGGGNRGGSFEGGTMIA